MVSRRSHDHGEQQPHWTQRPPDGGVRGRGKVTAACAASSRTDVKPLHAVAGAKVLKPSHRDKHICIRQRIRNE